MLTFREYVEGVLAPNRGPRPWLSRINPTPFTNARRKRIAGKVIPKINWFRPTVREVVPLDPTARLNPYRPETVRQAMPPSRRRDSRHGMT